MKKFVFNLETLLRHRINLEEKERNELSRLQFLLLTEISHRSDLLRQLETTASELTRLQIQKADLREIAWFRSYMDRIMREIGTSDERIKNLEQKLQAQKLVVIEAIKNRKVLDSLRKRKQKDYDLELERQGQKTVDEIVVSQFTRKRD